MKISRIILIAALCLPLAIHAQEAPPQKYAGILGEKMKLVMELDILPDRVQGFYYYDRYKNNIKLRGFTDGSGRLVLVESDEKGNITGVFLGRFSSPGRLEGKWMSPDGARVINFALEKVKTDRPAPGPVTINMIKIKKQGGDCRPDSGDCVKVDVIYPEVNQGAGPEAIKAMNNEIKKRVIHSNRTDQSVEAMIDKFIQDGLTEIVPDLMAPYVLSVNVSVLYNDRGILTLDFYEYSYAGGPHPNSQNIYLCLETSTGRPLKLEDFLVTGFEPRLNRIAEKKFRKEKDLNPYADLAEAGYSFDGNRFTLNRNFAVKKEGLLFQFNAYEIASYAEGPIAILIPWNEIQDLIKTDSQVMLPE